MAVTSMAPTNIRKDPNSNDGLATITNSGIAAGSYTLVATYGGDNQGKYYNGAQSNTVSLTIKPELGGPPPQPSLAINATAGARNGTLLLVSLTVTNNGTAPASGITLNQIALRTLAGTGRCGTVRAHSSGNGGQPSARGVHRPHPGVAGSDDHTKAGSQREWHVAGWKSNRCTSSASGRWFFLRSSNT